MVGDERSFCSVALDITSTGVPLGGPGSGRSVCVARPPACGVAPASGDGP